MSYIIFLISLVILVIAIAVTQLLMNSYSYGKAHVILSCVVYLSITELLLSMVYMASRMYETTLYMATSLLYFQTLSAPLALVMLQLQSRSVSKFFKYTVVVITLMLFNVLYCYFDTLYTPGWVYSLTIDMLAITLGVFFKVTPYKVVLTIGSFVLWGLLLGVDYHYFDYFRDDSNKYLLLAFITLIAVEFFLYRHRVVGKNPY